MSRSTLRGPLTYRLLIITEQIGDIRDRNAALEEYARKGVAESVGSWTFFELAGKIKHPVDLSAPQVGNSFKPVGPITNKQTITVALGTLMQAVDEPIWKDGEHNGRWTRRPAQTYRRHG